MIIRIITSETLKHKKLFVRISFPLGVPRYAPTFKFVEPLPFHPIIDSDGNMNKKLHRDIYRLGYSIGQSLDKLMYFF